ncbi:DUF2313 domain-containing protein [Gluconobacter sp. LMG 31484]|uniref:DUF2313 domain-containing protein n=1 Tax=Gluconobacter vitians TaxID=2728102 RepID=A0ABR9Y4G1_9PROT|nr:putative phage tail protein [Gluconobacter vitians]MBF0858788.1 DUF2313 domain-containing protein [Gluconobacter vitians]
MTMIVDQQGFPVVDTAGQLLQDTGTAGSRTAEQIAWERLSLLGPGSAWGGPNLAALIQAFSEPRAVLEADVAALRQEISPKTSVVLLDDYKTLLGPDPDGRDTGSLTTTQWQELLQSRWIGTGGARISDFVALGASFGVGVSITEPQPAICGAARCGAARASQHTLRFCWIVDLDASNSGLVTAIRAAAPADTTVYFRVNGNWI